MTTHPCADLFPLIEGREFDELVEDIRKFGLRTPILVDGEGRVLDGRNRLRACRKAGIEPHFETWNGRGSEAELIVSMNLHRRHLNESQRAMVASKLLELSQLTDSRTNWSSGNSAEQAGRLLNVSPMSVKRARQLRKTGDKKLIQAVEAGELRVSKAAALASRSKRRTPQRDPAPFEAGLWVSALPNQLDEAMQHIERSGYARPREVLLLAIHPKRATMARTSPHDRPDARPLPD